LDFRVVGEVNRERLEHIRKMNGLYGGLPPQVFYEAQLDASAFDTHLIRMGRNVLIQTGAVIGAWGMTFERDEQHRIVRMNQYGGVVIGDDVEIGANTVICRGSMPDASTVIGDGTKIDNLVDISHNVVVGKHCYLAPHVCLAGSCEIGDYCWLGLHVAVREHVHVGAHSVIGMGAIVVSDIPEYSIAYGVPAKVVEKRQVYKPDQP
jgi:UDP-3-O-[3-hydroxymyristoyl] glucosamine N-acyltransferase